MNKLHIDWSAIVRYGMGLSILFTITVLGSFWLEPLVWAPDFPEEVQQQIGELPEGVIAMSLAVMFTVMGLMFVFAVLMNRTIFRNLPTKASFMNFFINAFLLLTFMNAFDLVVVDWLIFGGLQPEFMMIEGAETYIEETVTPGFHVVAFFKGQIYLLVTAAIAATICIFMARRWFRNRGGAEAQAA
ncbi:MAG: hypothetical protein AAGC71_16600 [Pseudomonadota bacterium]